MQVIYKLIEDVAPTDATVLIQGESGTGKEVMASMIHRLSPRRDQPFIAINCAALPDNLLKRCRHVVGENERVLEACRFLELGDLPAFGALMHAAHVSLRDDFEVSHPTLDRQVDTAMETPGVLGSRLTGAGFGGCTVNLVREAAVPAFTERVRACVVGKGASRSVSVVKRMLEAGLQ